MEALKCDVCGGSLQMQAGGQIAVCEYCGMQYSLARVREKVQEIKGVVQIEGAVQARQTGTQEDIRQWKLLLKKYMDALDYQSALPVAKKILEADPRDEEANQIYDDLQKLQYFDIRNGTLVKYNGTAEEIQIPKGVRIIAKDAFSILHQHPYCNCRRRKISLPDTLIEMYDNPVVEELIMPDSVVKGELSFPGSIRHLRLSNAIKSIDDCSVRWCSSLEELNASEEYIKELIEYIYQELKRYIEDYYDPDKSKGGILGSQWGQPYYKEVVKRSHRKQGVCQECGASFKGLFFPKCTRCGKPKDY